MQPPHTNNTDRSRHTPALFVVGLLLCAMAVGCSGSDRDMDAATSCEIGIPAIEQLDEDLSFSRSSPNDAAMKQLTEISEKSQDADLAEAAAGLVANTRKWYELDQPGNVAYLISGHRSLFLGYCPE